MTTANRDRGVGLSMCRRCGHDLQVVRQGKAQGEIRCSNQSCRFARQTYKMGKSTNEGPVTA